MTKCDLLSRKYSFLMTKDNSHGSITNQEAFPSACLNTATGGVSCEPFKMYNTTEMLFRGKMGKK